MVNKVLLIGNLGRDPEVRRLESGAVVAKFSVATHENYLDKKSNEWKTLTEWHDVVVWRNLAERAERDLKKGKLVYVEGKLTTRKWTDKDGNDRYTTEVLANTFKLLERRESAGGFGSGMPSEEPATFSSGFQGDSSNANSADTSAGNESLPADDLPF